MCGIAGIIRWDGEPVLESEIRGMCQTMVHRGPDDEGIYLAEGVGLGMRRLSIIDLDTGQQPICNEDGTIWVVFNGEIYNYRELRAQLVRQGHVLRTSGDTETLVHLYESYGERCVDHLRGMFSFAIWDTRRRRLLVARDRLGIKPLYYAALANGIAFASELKPLLTLRGVERRLSWEAIGHLLTFLTTPPAQSIVDGIRKLEPGRILTTSASRRAVRIERYWDVRFEPDEYANEDQLVERLRAHLAESVALHEISDVPVGAFLSGGIDSSAVVATMVQRATSPVKTFSLGFVEPEYDELRYARRVADALGTEHHELVLTPDVVSIADDLSWFLDEPFGDTSAIPTYMISKLAAEHVTVVLSGDGGDELFAGYDKYAVNAGDTRFDQLPRLLRKLLGNVGAALPHGARGRRFLCHLALDGSKRYLDASALFRADELRALLAPAVFDEIAAHDPWTHALAHLGATGVNSVSALQYCDLQTYLPLDILTKVDRTTMACSIEARPPLLDHKLVEFAATLPPQLQTRNGTSKYLLKQAMRGVLPDEIIDRPKRGFALPLATWFRGKLAGFAREILDSESCRARGLFNPAYVNRVIRRHERGRDLDLHLWTMVSLELWCRRVLDRPLSAPQAIRAPRVDVQASRAIA